MPRRSHLIVLPVLLLASRAFAQEAPQPPPSTDPPASQPAPELSNRIEEVDQRARIVERRLELLEEEAAKAKAESPVLTAGDKGFNVRSADGGFIAKVRGLIHADGRQYFDDKELRLRDTFLIRRARPLLEASFADVADFRLMPDFGGGTAVVQDAYVDLRPFPWLKLRAGKYKPPVGLERLQSASAIIFAERALPTSLAPNRDVGAMLHGLIGGGIVSYELGIFNGVVDGGTGDADNSHAKDFVGRLFLQPLKSDPYSLFANLGIGFAASTGNQRGTPATFQASSTGPRRTAVSSPTLPAFRSAGQQTFFSYLVNDDVPDATVYARGRRTRLAPQGFYYYGPFGLLGEYIQSAQRVVKGAQNATLTHRSWQVAGTVVLGGKNAFEGVTVLEPLSVKKGTWGALELAARFNVLTIDDDTFPLYASPTRSAKEARGIGGALNWHWNRNVKLSVTFERTDFQGGAPDGDRPAENVLFQRVQATF